MRDTDHDRVTERREAGHIMGIGALPLWRPRLSPSWGQYGGRIGIEVINAEVVKEPQHLRVAPQQSGNKEGKDGKPNRLDNHKCGHATPLCGVRRHGGEPRRRQRALCYART
jgi:hypothetical protein